MSLQAVIDKARADLGYTESPSNSNKTKYGEWYGMNGKPWCVMALAYWFAQAGERMAFFGGGKTASCRTLLRWYREQGLTADKQAIQVGDILILNFSGKKRDGELDTEHCGLVVEKGPLAGTWYCIEGNTTPGEEGTPQEQANGGCVAKKMRSVKNVVGVCRPKYQPEPVKVDDVSGHWYSEPIEWAKEKGLLEGYPDGSFKPNNPLTRAEACAMAERLYRLIMEDDGK